MNRSRGALALLLVVGVVVAGFGNVARAAPPPPLPGPTGGEALQLAASPIAPGAQGSLSVGLANPLSGNWTGVVVTLNVYGEGSPGSLRNVSAGASWAPQFTLGGTSSTWANLSVASLPSGGSRGFAVGVTVPASAPVATYFVRTQLSFQMGGDSFLLRSRGFFSAALWQEATEASNGTPTLNLTRLNVSGVTPDGSIPVAPSPENPWVWGLLAGAAGLGVAGFYVARREMRGPTSGTRPRSRWK